MPLTLEPLADGTDGWVLALERLAEKIKDPNLSFYKYCMTAFGKAPKTFALEEPGPNAMVFDPQPSDCPAVVLDIQNPGNPEDHGAGAERWPFTVGVYFKAFAKDGNKKALLSAWHELIRTVFCGWRQGQLDILSSIAGGGYSLLPTDLTPEISRPQTGMLMARAGFAVRFLFAETILG